MKKLKLMATLALASQLTGGQAQNLLNGLQACYPLDNSAVNMAVTGSGLNGTPFNVTGTTDRFGNTNGAYAFTGVANSYVELPNDSRLKPTNGLSFSAWVKFSNNAASQYIVFTKNTCGQYFEGYAFAAVKIGSTLKLQLVKSSNPGCNGASQKAIAGSTTLNTGIWYHVGFYAGTDSLKMFLNGNPEGAPISTGGIAFSYDSKKVILGGTNEGFNLPLNGSMDAVRFYNRKLSNAEFYQISTSVPVCSSISGPGTTYVNLNTGWYADAAYGNLPLGAIDEKWKVMAPGYATYGNAYASNGRDAFYHNPNETFQKISNYLNPWAHDVIAPSINQGGDIMPFNPAPSPTDRFIYKMQFQFDGKCNAVTSAQIKFDVLTGMGIKRLTVNGRVCPLPSYPQAPSTVNFLNMWEAWVAATKPSPEFMPAHIVNLNAGDVRDGNNTIFIELSPSAMPQDFGPANSGALFVRGNLQINYSACRMATSLEEETSGMEGDFMLYPNPNNGVFVLKSNKVSNGTTLIEITDVMGRSIQKRTVEKLEEERIDLSGFNDGIYFVQITCDNLMEMKKVIKK